MRLNKRDREIINDLNRFRVMDRDSIIEIYFQGLAKPTNSANNVLNRLYRTGAIDRSTAFQPYLYFSKETSMKKNSQKIGHYLEILNTYKSLNKYAEVENFMVELCYKKGLAQPDAFCILKTKYGASPFFIELQNSIYSEKVMSQKIKRYESLWDSGLIVNEAWNNPDNPVFPHVLIISNTRYQIETDYPIKFIQIDNIETFLDHFIGDNKQVKNEEVKKEVKKEVKQEVNEQVKKVKANNSKPFKPQKNGNVMTWNLGQ